MAGTMTRISAIACAAALFFSTSDGVDAGRGPRHQPSTCSQQLAQMLTTRCKKSDNQADCQSNSQKKYNKCLKTGTWKIKDKELTLAKE
jgi:hypothetical protein